MGDHSKCQHWRLCVDCIGFDEAESYAAEIARLRAELAATRQERDTEADAVTDQRETIKRLRAELAEARAELDDLRGAYRTRFQQLRDAEMERDAALRERDARPEISPEDAAAREAYLDACERGAVGPAVLRLQAACDRVREALRAHAASAPPPSAPATNGGE